MKIAERNSEGRVFSLNKLADVYFAQHNTTQSRLLSFRFLILSINKRQAFTIDIKQCSI